MLLVVAGFARISQRSSERLKKFSCCSQALMLLVVANCAGIGQLGSKRLQSLLAAVRL
jgi:hypothetical protein